MCAKTRTYSITKVQSRYFRLVSSAKCAKSVILKLKQWVEKLKGVQLEPFNNIDEIIERDNASNENKLNVVKSKMAYTVEELRDIVDDNLANELREIEAITGQQ